MPLPDLALTVPLVAFNEVQAAAAAGFVRVGEFQRARQLGQFPKPVKELAGVGPVWSWQQIETWLAAKAAVVELPVTDLARQGSNDVRPSPAPGTRPTMMRVRDVADRWAMDVDTIYAMIRRGELEAQRFGAKCIRVPRSAVEEHEQGQGPTGSRTVAEANRSSGRLPANAPMAMRVAATVEKMRTRQ